MITRDIANFVAHARTLAPDFGPATARAAFLVSPDGFMRAEQSAQDNRYMADAGAFDTGAALREHRTVLADQFGRRDPLVAGRPGLVLRVEEPLDVHPAAGGQHLPLPMLADRAREPPAVGHYDHRARQRWAAHHGAGVRYACWVALCCS